MSGVATAHAEQRKYKTLKEELARIGNLIEDGKRRLEGLRVNEVEEVRLLEQLPKLHQQEKDLLESIARLKGAETEAANGTQRAQKAHGKISSAYRETSDLHISNVGRHSALRRQVEVLEVDRQSIDASIKERGRQEISKANPVLAAMNRVLASVRADITEAKKDLASMASKRKASLKLSTSIKADEKRSREIADDIAQKERILKAKSVEVDALDGKLEEKKRAHDIECARAMTAINEEKKALSVREGRVNRTVQWIKDRAGKLSQAKRELEDFRGKDLSHIIIPDVSDLE